MKATITRSALATALGIVKSAAARSGTLPILTHVRLQTVGNTIRLTCSDLDTTLTTTVPAEVKTAGDLTVKADTLLGLIRSFVGDEPVTLSATKTLLGVTFGQSHYDLGILSSEEFPPAAELKNASTVNIPQATLLGLLGSTQFPIATADANRYVLQGAYLNVNGKLTVAATDGRRLACAYAAFNNPAIKHLDDCDECSTIIPKRAVTELMRLLSSEDEAGSVACEITDKALRFTFGDVVLTTKAIEGSYPDYRKVIPEVKDSVLLSRSDLLTALKRVSLINPERCVLEFEGQMLTVSGRSADKEAPGKAEETLLIPKVNAPSKIMFNTRYLIDALESQPLDEVEFSGTSDAPGIFRTPDHNWLAVTMPMRENDAKPAAAPAKKEAAAK